MSTSARLRLFCFAYAGGSATVFAPWRTALAPQIEVVPVQLPGRGVLINEPPFTRLLPLVQWVLSSLRDSLAPPFAFFGHSMGALLSYELARELRRQGGPLPQRLLVSAFRAPHLPDPDPPVHSLPTPEFVAKLHELQGTPPEVLAHAELMDLLLPILRADFAVCETYRYRPEPPLDCPISIFGGLQDDQLSHEDLVDWHTHTRAPTRLHVFPGNHFFLHSARDALLEAIAHDLALHQPPANALEGEKKATYDNRYRALG